MSAWKVGGTEGGEQMSPQPTQAHLDKATCWIVKRPLNVSHQIDSLAQLIADSIADSEAQAAQAAQATKAGDRHGEPYLTAAAPDLLAALVRLTEKTERANAIQHSGGAIEPEDWAELYQMSNEARAAIAKAEGRA